ncbi:MAG: alpha/beta hydrolase [Candidatus Methanoplasma sp.]|jgi:pimeloyl-ACP methyl ester carboxylesterase|nr:alpha/beta hydrolase [Candidatus Methanoplasma sp.]
MSFIQTDGAKIHCRTDGCGPPVLLLTGFGADIGFWDKTVKMMSDRFTLIRIDNRGSGRTEYDGRFGMDDMADDAAAVLDALGVKKAAVLGWSLGSNIAQNFAIRHPDRVDVLILVSSYLRRPARASLVLGKMTDGLVEGADPSYFGVVLNTLCFDEGLFERKERDGLRIGLPQFTDPQGLRCQLDSVEDFDTRESARTIKAPTLCVHGTADIMVGEKYGDELADAIPDCESIKAQGAGHIINPALYIPQVMDFIGRRSALF